MAKPPVSKIVGIFPFYKEAGISCFTIQNWIQLHVAYECSRDNVYVPFVDFYKAMEPFSSGVLTVAIGKPSLYIKYLKYCDSRYTVDLRLGQSTVTDYYQSQVTETKPFDHINLDDVKKACESFIGTHIQTQPQVTFLKPLKILYDNDGDEKIGVDSWESYLNLDNQMRYRVRYSPQHRSVTCHSIEITKFEPPDLSVKVHCSIPFSMRSFSRDLFKKLDTCGSQVKLVRTQEGPFTLDHCIDRTDLYLKYLKPALKKHTEICVNFVRPYLDKTPFFTNNRPGKHR